jgi:endonuclease/exonuclease/phosphatase family metal-dependent hydrolase
MRRQNLVAGLVAGLLGVFFFMGLELPARSKEGANLKVMSYNIRAGLGGPKEISEYLAESGIEIVALQEARAPLADPKADPVPTISEGLEGFSLARGGSRGELVVLSRHSIKESREIDLGGVARALDVRLDVAGEPLRFRWLNVTAESRAIQFEALSQHLEEGMPTLILGDFKTPPNSEGHDLLSQSLSDCFGAVGGGFGYTFRADVPVWRIDYIWASKELVPCRAQVENSQLSDHRPLVVELAWKNREKLVRHRSPTPGDQ